MPLINFQLMREEVNKLSGANTDLICQLAEKLLTTVTQDIGQLSCCDPAAGVDSRQNAALIQPVIPAHQPDPLRHRGAGGARGHGRATNGR
jgi:hypothetical protein